MADRDGSSISDNHHAEEPVDQGKPTSSGISTPEPARQPTVATGPDSAAASVVEDPQTSGGGYSPPSGRHDTPRDNVEGGDIPTKDKAAQPSGQHLRRGTGSATPNSMPESKNIASGPTEAKTRYQEGLPTGHTTIRTSGEGALCGFRAVINTIRAMHPGISAPSIGDLQDIFKSPEFADHTAAFGLNNQDTFFVGQVAAVLHYWGQTYRDENLQLGYILNNVPYLVPHPNQKLTTIVWIAHDGNNHYEGVRARKRPQSQAGTTGATDSGNGEAGRQNATERIANPEHQASTDVDTGPSRIPTTSVANSTEGSQKRKVWHLKSLVRSIIIIRRMFSKWFQNKLCDRCAGLELKYDRFVIQDHSSDRSQQAYQTRFRHTGAQSITAAQLGSGSGKYLIGTLEEIEVRSEKSCPFCTLVLQSLQDFDYGTDSKAKHRSAKCYASWQVDGREVSRDHLGHVTSSRPRTRRIQLRWNNGFFEDTYLVLVAPESTRLPDSAEIETGTLFLGRHFSSAAHNQAKVKGWLDLCHDSHGPLCKITHGPEFHDIISKAYFGVVDVLKMRVTSLPKGERYVALSYMWREGKRYTTSMKTIHDHQADNGLDKKLSRLPRVISDAIRLVREIGERYIWIDSLCIVQDSPVSWKLNAAVMDQVYGNAHVTICAADGQGAMAGLMGLSRDRQIIQHSEACTNGLRLQVTHLAETYIKRSRWNKRGWTFQERLLSKRCILFAENRVYYQCRSATMSEDIVAEQQDAGWSIELVQAPSQMLQDLSTRAFWVYTECVQLYSARELGKPTDILAAFNGMSNLIGKMMGSPLVFGLPSSHFDLALLWEPTSGSVLREPKIGKDGKTDRKEEGEYAGAQFPTWSWCGWKDSAMEYRQETIAGCLTNVHQWLIAHTWISWYIRDGHGNLRPIWSAPSMTYSRLGNEGLLNAEDSYAAKNVVDVVSREGSDTIVSWRGYGSHRSAGDPKSDSYGRILSEELHKLERSKFYRTLPEFPYHVSTATAPAEPDKQSTDQRFLQFWTWSAFLRLNPHDQSSKKKLGDGLVRYDIADYTGDWCGTIVLDKTWANHVKPESEHEFLAISDAIGFSEEENDVWTYYVPKERLLSEWDLYYVLLVTRTPGPLGRARRRGLGKVFKEAFNNSCLPGKKWKEIILE